MSIDLDLGQIVLLLSALLGTGGIAGYLKIRYDRRDGVEGHRVREVERIYKLYEAAQADADLEARRRRLTAEYASRLIRAMIEAGIPQEHIEPWPRLPPDEPPQSGPHPTRRRR